MGIVIPDNLGARMAEHRQFFALAVESLELPAVLRGLERFRDRLYPCDDDRHDPQWHRPGEDCPGPSMVSEVIPLPAGAALLVDAGDLPKQFLHLLPDALREELAAAGVSSATVRLAEDSHVHEVVLGARNAVLLVAVGRQDPARRRPLQPVPAHWADLGLAWLGDGPKEASVDLVDVGSVSDASVCAVTRASAAAVSVVSVGPGSSVRLFYTSPSQLWPYVVFGAAGDDLHGEQRLQVVDDLVALARRLAPEVAQAFLDFQPDFRRVGGPYRPPHPPIDPAKPHKTPTMQTEHAILGSEILFEAFPYMVLTQHHVDRLGGAVDVHRIEGVEPARYEVRFDPLDDWLPDSPRHDDAVLAARAALAPAIMTTTEALWETRSRRA
jgi:hypothetical protein